MLDAEQGKPAQGGSARTALQNWAKWKKLLNVGANGHVTKAKSARTSALRMEKKMQQGSKQVMKNVSTVALLNDKFRPLGLANVIKTANEGCSVDSAKPLPIMSRALEELWQKHSPKNMQLAHAFPSTFSNNLLSKPVLSGLKTAKPEFRCAMATSSYDHLNSSPAQYEKRREKLRAQFLANRERRTNIPKPPFRIPSINAKKFAKQQHMEIDGPITIFEGRRQSIDSTALLRKLRPTATFDLDLDMGSTLSRAKLRQVIHVHERNNMYLGENEANTRSSKYGNMTKDQMKIPPTTNTTLATREFARRGSVRISNIENLSFIKTQKTLPIELLSRMQGLSPFESMSPSELVCVVSAMEFVISDRGEVLLNAFGSENSFYYLQKGECLGHSPRHGGTHSYKPGEFFGENHLLFDGYENKFTVLATSPCEMWKLSPMSFRDKIARENDERINDMETYIRHASLFNYLATPVMEDLLYLFTHEKYKEGAYLQTKRSFLREKKLFVIKEGCAKWFLAHTNCEGGTLGPGDYFGGDYLNDAECEEDSVPTTLMALSNTVECYSINIDKLRAFFGSSQIIASNKQLEASKQYYPSSLPKTIPQLATPEISGKKDLPMLDVMRCKVRARLSLGKWSSEVAVHQRQRFGKPEYALLHVRCIAKQKCRPEIYEELQHEKALLSSMEQHPFIAKLCQVGQDKHALYMAFEACPEGNLKSQALRQERNYFDQKDLRFYIASLVLVLEHLRRLRVAHRDIVAEKVGLDKNGYIKLQGFQYAKKILKRSFTLCGTPSSMSPEMILFRGHSSSTDVWGLGVLTHELLFCRSPFKKESDFETCREIVRGKLPRMTMNLTNVESRDFVYRTLKHRPNFRIGCGFKGISALRNHSWFVGFNWDRLEQRSLVSPCSVKSRTGSNRYYGESFNSNCYGRNISLADYTESELSNPYDVHGRPENEISMTSSSDDYFKDWHCSCLGGLNDDNERVD